MNELKKYSTAQLVEELSSREEIGVYNCDLYKHDNYRATIQKQYGDWVTIHPPTQCDVIVVNREEGRQKTDGK